MDTRRPIEKNEWESTISVEVEKRVFDDFSENTASDVILIFTNGSRLSERTVQRKVIKEKKLVLGFADGRFYPIRRTQATETTATIEPKMSVEKVVHRRIISSETREDGCKLRMACNKEEVEAGARYTLTCEIEYPCGSRYEEIRSYEMELMSRMHEQFGSVRVAPDKMTLNEIFSCTVPKVQIWTCFNQYRPYLWAYKWNGVKAKFMCVNGHAYVWPDANEIYTQPCSGDLSAVEHMCLQVELMEDRIVIVEVIAASYGSKIYSVEPMTNVAILSHLNATLGASSAGDVGEKPLVVQTFYDTRLPKRLPDDREDSDGFIVVQGELTIKWKAPTVDVKCVGPHRFMVGSVDANTVMDLPELDEEGRETVAGVEGCIYEMASNFKILRRRTDRITCSTNKEYKLFLESCKLIDPVAAGEHESRASGTDELYFFMDGFEPTEDTCTEWDTIKEWDLSQEFDRLTAMRVLGEREKIS